MAMSQRSSGYGRFDRTQRIRPRQFVRPVYEDYRPKSSEWKDEGGAFVLSVYLPGFSREQINLTKDESGRNIIVYGERSRLIGDSKLRFNTSYPVPPNCNLAQLTTQFLRGTLTIIIPKVTSTPPQVPKEEATSTSQDEEETKSTRRDVEKISIQEPQPKTEKNEGTLTSIAAKQEEEEIVIVKGPPSPEKGAGEALSQKGQEENRQVIDDQTASKDGGPSVDISNKKEAEKEEDKEKNDVHVTAVEEDKENADNKEQMLLVGHESVVVPNVIPKGEEKEKIDDQAEDGKEEADQKKARDMVETNGLADKPTGVWDEWQLAVNICVAVTVIMGIGAYLFNSTFD